MTKLLCLFALRGVKQSPFQYILIVHAMHSISFMFLTWSHVEVQCLSLQYNVLHKNFEKHSHTSLQLKSAQLCSLAFVKECAYLMIAWPVYQESGGF